MKYIKEPSSWPAYSEAGLKEWYAIRWAKKFNTSFNYKDYFPKPSDESENESFDLIEEGDFCIQVLDAVRLDKKELYIYTEDGSSMIQILSCLKLETFMGKTTNTQML